MQMVPQNEEPTPEPVVEQPPAKPEERGTPEERANEYKQSTMDFHRQFVDPLEAELRYIT